MPTRKEQAAATATALKHAARELFEHQGYRDTKITDITVRAGRAAGSFYNHFADKDDLLTALLQDEFAAGDDEVNDEASGHDSDFSKRSAIRWHVDAYWRFWQRSAPVMNALTEAAANNPAFARRLQGMIHEQQLDLRDHLGFVKATLPGPEQAVLAAILDMLATFHQTWRASHGFDGTVDSDTAVDMLTTFIHRALNASD